MPFLFRAAGVCLAAWLTCALSHAQSAPALTPPVAKSSTDVPYPADGEGDAEVTLELVVEKDGSVSTATVVEGREPFAQQARQAALAWLFTPALRDGTPVAARIRARVAFHHEPEAVEGPAPSAADPSASPAAAAPPTPDPPPETPLEVTVVGVRHDIGQTTLDEHEIREMPGAFGDAFRAIEALPGVTPLASGLPYFYVRGAPPNNAGYYVDGVRVPLLFHLGIAQSVIHPGLIDHVDVFSSAAPARYGGFAGPVIAGRTREPRAEFHGEANLRLVDAGALVEAPFAQGRGSALVAGRYGYPGPIVAAFTDDTKIAYWDYQARASWKLGSQDTLSVFGFGAHDYLASRSPSGDPEARKQLREQFVSDFHRLDLRYDHALPEGRLRLALTGGYDAQGAEPTYLKNHSVAARLEVEQELTSRVRFRGGMDAELDRYRIRVTRQGPNEPAVPQSATPPPTNLSAALYADFVWRITRRVELVPGARFGLFASTRAREAPQTGNERNLIPAADPRLSTRVTLSPGVAWLTTFGLAHQYPSLRLGELPAAVVSVPGFPFGVHRVQSAAQASQGIELALPAAFSLTTTGFYTQWWGLTDLGASCFQLMLGDMPQPLPGEPVPPYVCPNNAPVQGRAFGLELLLRRPFTERLSGWLSYTLSRSTREAHFVTPAGGEDVANVPSEFDRTHVLNAVLSYDLGRRWRVGSRFVFYSGTPYSKLDGSLPVPPYGAYRNPAFYRVDFRLEKRWQLNQTASIAFVLEGQNITLSKEKSNLGLECKGMATTENAKTTCEQSTIGPLTIPSVGVEAFF